MDKKINAIILCGGKSSRMGKDKAFLTWNNKTILELLIEKIQGKVFRIIIVAGENFQKINSIVKNYPKVMVVYNENHEFGMFSSVLKGLNSIDINSPVILQMIDQPFISEDIYNRLIDNYTSDYLVFQPIMNGRKGHPIFMSTEFIEKAKTFSMNNTLRDVMHSIDQTKIKLLNVDDSSIFDNLNTPESWKKYFNPR